MCTVSYVSANGKTIITSNRDEKVLRSSATEPKNYFVNNKKIIFPKDTQAGGTWFAVDEQGTVLILLNGAKEKHILKPKYRKSRGLIVLDIIGNSDPFEFWKAIELENIEPFTLILFQNNQLFQLQWNGFDKESVELNTNKNYIWSSATLYSKEVRAERVQWFYSFLESNSNISETQLIDFHLNTKKEDTQNGLTINRNDVLKTLSITQAILEMNKVAIVHHDLITNLQNETKFIII